MQLIGSVLVMELLRLDFTGNDPVDRLFADRGYRVGGCVVQK